MELSRQPVTFDNILQTFLEDTWKGFSLTEPIVTDITDSFLAAMSGTKKQESINLKEILIAYIFDKISFNKKIRINLLNEFR